MVKSSKGKVICRLEKKVLFTKKKNLVVHFPDRDTPGRYDHKYPPLSHWSDNRVDERSGS